MLKQINNFDHWVVANLNNLAKKNQIFFNFAKILAIWPVYLIPLVLVFNWFWSPRWREVEIRATIAGLFAWQVVNRIIQHFFNRPRPIDSSDSIEIFFHRQTNSFPSDHAAFGMALFLSFYLAGERSVSWVLLGLTLIFSVFRVATGLHFPSDILVGWLVGFASASFLNIISYWFDKAVGKPLIHLAKKLHLA